MNDVTNTIRTVFAMDNRGVNRVVMPVAVPFGFPASLNLLLLP
ncbi:MAG: hypothetical protein PVJ39_03420 [Gammaproteobacteria bacterium]|jgi:hypothetical protein